jgi:myosin heavy subunit
VWLGAVKKQVDDDSDEVFTSKKGQNGVDDMVMLSKIDEGSLVENLKKRYDAGERETTPNTRENLIDFFLF